MRASIAATEAVATVQPACPHLALAQPIPRLGDAERKQVAQGRAMGSAATTEASPGAGELEDWPKVGQSRVPTRASSHGRPPSRLYLTEGLGYVTAEHGGEEPKSLHLYCLTLADLRLHL